MTRPPKTRNPIAKAVTRIPGKVLPDKRRKLLAILDEQRELAEAESLYDNTEGGPDGHEGEA